jgi:hypothetical protein
MLLGYGWRAGFKRGFGGISARVADRSLHEHSSYGVNEREVASLGFRVHDGDDLLNPLRLAALVCSPSVHLGGLGTAFTGLRRLNAEPLKEF